MYFIIRHCGAGQGRGGQLSVPAPPLVTSVPMYVLHRSPAAAGPRSSCPSTSTSRGIALPRAAWRLAAGDGRPAEAVPSPAL
jgi:hypothetical protein